MAEVKLNHAGAMPAQEDTPSAQIVRAAQQEVVVTDARGRSITLRNPGVLAEYRLIEALGESAKNTVYLAMVAPLIFVTMIDGVLAPMPSNKSQVEALISRLDRDGLDAVVNGVQKHFGEQSQEAVEASVKNS
jgi:hypothetical protein